MNIKNLDDLKKFTDEIRSQAGYKDPIAFAIGRSIKGKSAKTISVNYAVVNMNENYGSAAVLNWAIEKNGIKIDNSGSEFVAPINSAITVWAPALHPTLRTGIETMLVAAGAWLAK